MNFIKKLWANPVIKTVVNVAIGGAIGAVTGGGGAIVFNQTTLITAAGGAIASVIGLYQQHPVSPNPAKQ